MMCNWLCLLVTSMVKQCDELLLLWFVNDEELLSWIVSNPLCTLRVRVYDNLLSWLSCDALYR